MMSIAEFDRLTAMLQAASKRVLDEIERQGGTR